ncbi:arabinosyltransferase RRA2-like [Andrographis paniculata]|uniref:arabinosyltransferase RRA2-like n=1 Tax=Andrographis paniculata TaxID=175694 RepID=UPI0021E83675|nr:arabinosyltransferase RRA2-like [Andrographis paniculata]
MDALHLLLIFAFFHDCYHLQIWFHRRAPKRVRYMSLSPPPPIPSLRASSLGLATGSGRVGFRQNRLWFDDGFGTAGVKPENRFRFDDACLKSANRRFQWPIHQELEIGVVEREKGETEMGEGKEPREGFRAKSPTAAAGYPVTAVSSQVVAIAEFVLYRLLVAKPPPTAAVRVCSSELPDEPAPEDIAYWKTGEDAALAVNHGGDGELPLQFVSEHYLASFLLSSSYILTDIKIYLIHRLRRVITSSSCNTSKHLKRLQSEFIVVSNENTNLQNQIKKLKNNLHQEKIRKNIAQKEPLKASPTNPTVAPDESVNPRLAKLLEVVAPNHELILVLANSNDYIFNALRIWLSSVQRLGIGNYLIFALDDNIVRFCQNSNLPVYRPAPGDDNFQTLAISENSHIVSGLKFRVLREFLLMGYGVVLSDVDIVFLQNPLNYLHRDSDIEVMTDGYDNKTAYGHDDAFYDDPEVGWGRDAHTIRLWAHNSGFFYIRPTLPAIELLDRVAARLARENNAWDQAVFNQELFIPSYPGYGGLHASRRVMDYLLFMNSKVLFKIVRKNIELRKIKPVIVHINYHTEKYERMKAVFDYYIFGKQNALDSFPDGSWPYEETS